MFQFHLHPPVPLTIKSYDWPRRSKRTRLTHDSWTEDQCVAAATATTPLTGEALDRRDGGGRPSGSVVLVATEGALVQRCSEGLWRIQRFRVRGSFWDRTFQTFPDIFTL